MKTLFDILMVILVVAVIGSVMNFLNPIKSLTLRGIRSNFSLAQSGGSIEALRAYGVCIDIKAAVDFANKDTNRLLGKVSLALARKSPYLNLLDGGTLPNGVSDVTRSVVQERAVSGQSLVAPVFQSDLAMCGTGGNQAQVGSTEYTEALQTIRGSGPRICVKTTRSAFMGSYPAAEDSLKKALIQVNNADVRATLVSRSGIKLTVVSSGSFLDMFNGNSQAIDTPFADYHGGLPDSQLNFALLKYLTNFMREDLLVEPFEDSSQVGGGVLKFIGSMEQIEKFRAELNIKEDARALVTGQYKWGEKTVLGYSWEGPYRGIAFGIDTQPLRFDYVSDGTQRDPAGNLIAAGQPIFIEPEIAVAVTKGYASRVNPAWARARFEVGIVLGSDTFRRRVPEQYTGGEGFKFPAQMAQGELEFAVIRDNDCNKYGDFGEHLYQISRSYRPERPHAVCAIIYKRCTLDFGLATCGDYPDYSSSASL